MFYILEYEQTHSTSFIFPTRPRDLFYLVFFTFLVLILEEREKVGFKRTPRGGLDWMRISPAELPPKTRENLLKISTTFFLGSLSFKKPHVLRTFALELYPQIPHLQTFATITQINNTFQKFLL